MPTPVSVTSTIDGSRRGVRLERLAAIVSAPAARHRVQRVLDDVGQRAREERPIDRDRRQVVGRRRRRSRCGRPARCDTARRPRRCSAGSVGRLGARASATRRSSRTPTRSGAAASPASRIAFTHSSSTGDSGRPRSMFTRRACSADSWIGVSGFLMSCATCRAMSAQASSRCVRSSSRALPLADRPPSG